MRLRPHGRSTQCVQRREEAVQRQLDATVDKYAAALELFDQWKSQRVKSKAELERALSGKSASEQVAELRRQIEMRTVGCGWSQFLAKWTFYSDERAHTIDTLKEMLLKDILPYEKQLQTKKKLPKAAEPPQTRVRCAQFKV